MPVTRSQTSSNQLNLFDILPPEIISYTLNFMDPAEYTGLPCTCRRALELVNATILAQLGTCQRSAEISDATLSTQPGILGKTLGGPEISATGRVLRLYRVYKAEMLETCVGYWVNPDGEDGDL
jgi:hypothetical protein